MASQEQLNRRLVVRSPHAREEQVLAGFNAVTDGFKDLAVSFENPGVYLARSDRPAEQFLGTPYVTGLNVSLDFRQELFN
jgi:hypothetical protein